MDGNTVTTSGGRGLPEWGAGLREEEVGVLYVVSLKNLSGSGGETVSV